eukprot:1152004-Pelagomonas_calceolata.AAC.2
MHWSWPGPYGLAHRLYAYKLASTRLALEKASFTSPRQDQASATASNPPDPHIDFFLVSLGEGNTRCLGPREAQESAQALQAAALQTLLQSFKGLSSGHPPYHFVKCGRDHLHPSHFIAPDRAWP